MILMIKYQDIQVSDKSLRQSLINYFNNGNYSACLNLLNNNSQLINKAFVAEIYNDIATILYNLEYEITPNIDNTLTTFFDVLQDLINKYEFINTWNSTVVYEKYQVVSYSPSTNNNNLYMYINDTGTSGIIPTNTNYWAFLGSQGAKGTDGLGLNLRYAWNSAVNYSAKDVVVYNKIMWVALQSNQNQIPSEGSSYWQFLAEEQDAEIFSGTSAPDVNFNGQIWIEIES